jgi:hypothetical protein
MDLPGFRHIFNSGSDISRPNFSLSNLCRNDGCEPPGHRKKTAGA